MNQNRPPKIAFFISSLVIGGVEKVQITYANELALRGYDVTVIYCYDGVLSGLLNGRVKPLNLGVSKLRYCIHPLVKLLKREKYDSIIATNVQTLFILISKFLARDKACIITSHHYYFNNVETPKYYKFLLRLVYNACDKVVAVSHGIYDELVEVAHVKKEKIVIIKNPIDYKKIEELSSVKLRPMGDLGNYIAWCGRMYEVKNLRLLISCYAELLNEYPSLKLVLIGDGVQKDDLEKESNLIGLMDKVIFMGVQTNPYPYINGAKVVALSSTSEAYPTVLLEALALGKTVVSTPTSGAIEILKNGKFGYISDSMAMNDYLKSLKLGLEAPLESEFLREYAFLSDNEAVIPKIEKLLLN